VIGAVCYYKIRYIEFAQFVEKKISLLVVFVKLQNKKRRVVSSKMGVSGRIVSVEG